MPALGAAVAPGRVRTDLPPPGLRVERIAGAGGFSLESGLDFGPVEIAYQTWGRYDPEAEGGLGNAVLVCHALTGDSDAVSWWQGVVGPGNAIDPARHFIIASNVLGGCRGSTGPGSPDPWTGRPYGLRFPQITVGDMVKAQALLLDALGVGSLALVTGGSLGGMQALTWALLFPERVGRAVVIGAPWSSPPLSIAWNEIARQAILADPDFEEGAYPPGAGPARGLAIARMLALTTYRSGESFWQRQGRRETGGDDPVLERLGPYATQLPAGHPFAPLFRMETYLHHQGEKLVRRFDANTYLYLTRAMDRFEGGRYAEEAARRPVASRRPRVWAVGIDSDLLYPAAEVRAVARCLEVLGYDARYVEIRSPHGHDAFLIEAEATGTAIRQALEDDGPVRVAGPDRETGPVRG